MVALTDIKQKVDIVDVFRPSEEAEEYSKSSHKNWSTMFYGYSLILKMIKQEI